MDTVKIEGGYISGMVIGEPGKELNVYRGIPYASPPIGDLRWKPPQRVTPWEDTRECTAYSTIAPQQLGLGPRTDAPQSEDCLYLNVLTPAESRDERLPVMVWLHGGGYVSGSGNDPIYNESRLPQQGVVVVTVSNRLGILGLLAHRQLSEESDNDVSGNYMFLDIIAALKWVKKNITAFGGNPENITIFGESGGGAKVSNLMASPLAKGLFHRAICESGVSVGGFAPTAMLKDIEANGERIFAKLGIDKEADSLKAVRALSWQNIMEAEHELNKELGIEGVVGGLWDAAVDGWFLNDNPTNIFKDGKQNAIPLIACVNMGELTGPGQVIMPWLIPSCAVLLSNNRKLGVNAYACIFDKVPSGWESQGCVSPHLMELGYVFGDWDNSSGFWDGLSLMATTAGAKTPEPGLADADRKVSEEMMAMWAQFARTGDPNVKGLVEWPVYEEDTDMYLYITEFSEAKSGYSKVAKEE
ncbi:carboxylesterase/lipase family protein [Chloroflexota bacterium]